MPHSTAPVPGRRSPPAPTADPLAGLLRRAARRADDPAVKAWLRALLRRGESASHTAVRNGDKEDP